MRPKADMPENAACAFKCAVCHEPADEISVPEMKFIDVIWSILRGRPSEMTPQEVRDQIEAEYPDRYVPEAHRRTLTRATTIILITPSWRKFTSLRV